MKQSVIDMHVKQHENFEHSFYLRVSSSLSLKHKKRAPRNHFLFYVTLALRPHPLFLYAKIRFGELKMFQNVQNSQIRMTKSEPKSGKKERRKRPRRITNERKKAKLTKSTFSNQQKIKLSARQLKQVRDR